jgi:hypothetical protein
MHTTHCITRFIATILKDSDYSVISVYDSVFDTKISAKCFKCDDVKPIIETLKKKLRERDKEIEE